MSTQLRILGLIAILAVGFLILGPEDEPPASDHQGRGPAESTTDRHLQPREPTPPIPGYDYGIVGRPDPYPEPPDAYHGGYAAPDAQARDLDGRLSLQTPDGAGAGTPADDPLFGPVRRPIRGRPARNALPPVSVSPIECPTLPPPGEGYSFRPPRKSPGARGRWQARALSPARPLPCPLPHGPRDRAALSPMGIDPAIPAPVSQSLPPLRLPPDRLLIDALPGATLLDLGDLEDELKSLLGIDVDLLTPGDLPPRFRDKILAEAQPV